MHIITGSQDMDCNANSSTPPNSSSLSPLGFPINCSNWLPFDGINMKRNDKNIKENLTAKKPRLTHQQLQSLEMRFEEEVKLEPGRKMKLARELDLPPRQIAIWFQNRRARWKAKQLEHLYNSLRLEFNVVSMEKQKLQAEVLRLKAILKKQAHTGNTNVSGGEETVVDQCSYLFHPAECSTKPVSTHCWGVLPIDS